MNLFSCVCKLSIVAFNWNLLLGVEIQARLLQYQITFAYICLPNYALVASEKKYLYVRVVYGGVCTHVYP